jgi:hypothetical protein
MVPEPPVSSVAHIIQLAVAPVFLITGVGALLTVLTNRLGRIVDRARKLEAILAEEDDAAERAALNQDLATHARRATLVYWAISLCTTCALLVSSVIVALFVGAFLQTNVFNFIVLLFTAAMLSLIGGLVLFLREIYVGITALHIGPREELKLERLPAGDDKKGKA